jgi:hypothetical protein
VNHVAILRPLGLTRRIVGRDPAERKRSQVGDWLIFRRESGCIVKWSLPKNVPVPLGFSSSSDVHAVNDYRRALTAIGSQLLAWQMRRSDRPARLTRENQACGAAPSRAVVVRGTAAKKAIRPNRPYSSWLVLTRRLVAGFGILPHVW